MENYGYGEDGMTYQAEVLFDKWYKGSFAKGHESEFSLLDLDEAFTAGFAEGVIDEKFYKLEKINNG